jgi:hypothetical protein
MRSPFLSPRRLAKLLLLCPQAAQGGLIAITFGGDPARWRAPLLTSYGEVSCPKMSEMPERLERLVPFLPVD